MVENFLHSLGYLFIFKSKGLEELFQSSVDRGGSTQFCCVGRSGWAVLLGNPRCLSLRLFSHCFITFSLLFGESETGCQGSGG